MPEFYIADVRKRANPDLNMVPQAIPERRAFPDDTNDGSPGSKEFERMQDIFESDPDDPVDCGIAGADGVTMEWTASGSFGQIDFYGAGSPQEEPQRFLSLYILSGASPEQDRAAMKPLEQYADFSQCLNFPLVLQVTEDLNAAWQHDAMQALRQGITPLVAAFLKANFGAQVRGAA